MRILEINDSHNSIGGAEIIYRKTIDILMQDHEIYSISFDSGKNIKNHFYLNTDKKNILIRTINKYSFNPFLYRKIKKIIGEIKPDVIHLHNINEAPITLLLACKGYKTIQTVHSYGVLCPTSWCVYKKDYKVCDGRSGLKCFGHGCVPYLYKVPFIGYLAWFKIVQKVKRATVHKFITPSIKLKEFMINNGFSNTISIYNPNTINKINVEKGKISDSFHAKQILYVGGISKIKGVDIAYEELKKLPKKYKVIFIGKGPLLDSLKKKNSNQNIRFLGSIPHEKIDEYYSRSSALIVPSVWMDNLPTVIIEAFNQSKPVIGSNRGGIPEMLQDKKLIFNDISEINEKIMDLLNDYENYKRICMSNSSRTSIFDAEKYKDKIIGSFTS